MDIERSIDKHNLRVGERYTLYLTDGRIRRGTFARYLSWNRVPNAGVQFSSYATREDSTQPFINQQGLYTLPLEFIDRVTQHNVGPNDDVSRIINSYLGGRKSRKSKKSKKSKKSNKSRKVKPRRLKYKKV